MAQANKAAATKATGKGRTHVLANTVAEQVKNGTQPAPRTEKKTDERFLRMSMNTYVKAIGTGLMHRQATLCWELAVDLHVYSQDADKKKAQETLFHVYAEAGYDCKDSKGVDYKTIHRRISYGYKLFQWLGGKAAVDEIIGVAAEMKAIQALVSNLEQYNFKGMNDVMARIGEAVVQKRGGKKEEKLEAPKQAATPAAAPQPSTEDKALLNQVAAHIEQQKPADVAKATDRRAENRPANGDVQVLTTEHMRLAIPKKEVTSQELMALSMQILQLANELQAEEKSKAAQAKEAVAA